LRKYFPESKTLLHLTSTNYYKQTLLGSGYRSEDKLTQKRFIIASSIINQEDNYDACLSAIVLFHTPTNFVIEYLRVDMITPYKTKYTIIDGRRDMKEWIYEYEESKINKRVYPQYRKEETFKH
jgi:hypothetical protein